ncbi:MAG TPA: GspH/FimT family pseudopilin [Pseudomonas sp.]|nr:GspH/FimT family pseudopilin [Pseudomonas sp.]
MKSHYQQAVSLIELLITLLLVAVLTTIAQPNFSDWVERRRIETLRDQVQAQLYHARTSSVLHHRDVEACGSSDGLNCDERWGLGWLLHFPDTHELISQQRLSTYDRLRWTGVTKRIRFHDNGTAPMSNGRFYFCDQNDKVALQIVLNRQGRLRRVTGLESGQNPNLGCR